MYIHIYIYVISHCTFICMICMHDVACIFPVLDTCRNMLNMATSTDRGRCCDCPLISVAYNMYVCTCMYVYVISIIA